MIVSKNKISIIIVIAVLVIMFLPVGFSFFDGDVYKRQLKYCIKYK